MSWLLKRGRIWEVALAAIGWMAAFPIQAEAYPVLSVARAAANRVRNDNHISALQNERDSVPHPLSKKNS